MKVAMSSFHMPRFRVHALFWILPALLAVGYATGSFSLAEALYYLLAGVLLFLFVVLHEFAHALAMAREGVPAREILLLPWGGLAIGPPPPPGGAEIVIAAAGPAVNLFVAAVLFGVLAVVRPGAAAGLFRFAPLEGGVLDLVFKINMLLAAFNLLPAFPMDGGRIVRGALSCVTHYVRATDIAFKVGAAVAGAMAIYGVVTGHWLLVAIAVVVVAQGYAERKNAPRVAYMHASVSRRAGAEDWQDEEGWPAGDAPAEDRDRTGDRPGSALERWRARGAAEQQAREAAMRRRVDGLLEKIHASGMDSLTWSERRFLKKASRHFGGEGEEP
jgi:Zn-dependent protease